jgi:hypothetical protein
MCRELRNLLEVEAFEALEAGDHKRATLLADAVRAEKEVLFEHVIASRRIREHGLTQIALEGKDSGGRRPE